MAERFNADSTPKATGIAEEDDKASQHRSTKMKIAIGSLLSYFVIGWYAYCWGGKDYGVEEMSFTDATYFLMVTLTVSCKNIAHPLSVFVESLSQHTKTAFSEYFPSNSNFRPLVMAT